MDSAAIISFFKEVADASPIPVMVYNYPGVTAGLDVNSDILVELSRHENIVGAKLTCGGIGKVPRVSLEADEGFAVLSGQIDWMGPAMEVGAMGGITGLANLWPRVCFSFLFLFSCLSGLFGVWLLTMVYRPALSSITSTNLVTGKKPQSYS